GSGTKTGRGLRKLRGCRSKGYRQPASLHPRYATNLSGTKIQHAVRDDDINSFVVQRQRHGVPDTNFHVLKPGSSRRSKRLPPHRFRSVYTDSASGFSTALAARSRSIPAPTNIEKHGTYVDLINSMRVRNARKRCGALLRKMIQ